MCPQSSSSCDAQNEGGEANPAGRLYGRRALKREQSVLGRITIPGQSNSSSSNSSGGSVHNSGIVRRPVARYRRSVVIDAGASGSSEPPILVHPDQHATEIIDLEAVDAAPAPSTGLDRRSVPGFLHNRVEMIQGEPSVTTLGMEEPAAKRIRKPAEGEGAAAVASALAAGVGGTGVSGRSGRSHGFVRANGRAWARERSRQGAASAAAVMAAAAAASSSGGRRVVGLPAPVETDVHEGSQPQLQARDDERMARELQREFSTAASTMGNDANFARALQAEENRLVFRPPAPVALDPARFQLFLDRQRLFYAQQQAASSSRQGGDAQRHRSRLVGDGRRFRFLQERLSAFGALLHSQIPLAMQLAYVDRDFNENDYEMLLALDEGVQQRGASQSRIDELPVTECEEADKSEACSICLEVPESGQQIRRLPCMHGFHQNCIDTWLQRRPNCPVCKSAI